MSYNYKGMDDETKEMLRATKKRKMTKQDYEEYFENSDNGLDTYRSTNSKKAYKGYSSKTEHAKLKQATITIKNLIDNGKYAEAEKIAKKFNNDFLVQSQIITIKLRTS